MIETRHIPTRAGPVRADVLVCDHCGAEAIADNARRWARIESVGIPMHEMQQYPELIVCSWPCLRSINRSFPLNTEPQE